MSLSARALPSNPRHPTCRSCGRDLDRRERESLVQFRRRRICSMTECTGQGTLAVSFPQAVRAAEVPARCPRVGCQGPWRVVECGVVCVLCGRGIMVVEALLARATRGD